MELQQSRHEWAVYTNSESILYKHPSLAKDMGSIALFPEGKDDLFTLFPPEIKPPGRAFLIGGLGSHTGLHVDNYNWTGWNALVQANHTVIALQSHC